MNKTLKKIWNTITTLLVALVVLLAILLVGARLLGYQVFSVLSGSMEPTYHTGSLIYVKAVDPFTIEEGTAITFMMDETTVATHRVVGIVPDENDPTVIRFRTKGDANANEDGTLVHYKNVLGVPVFTIPYLGFVASYIQNPPGTYIAMAAGAVLLMLVFIPDLFDDDNGKKKKKKKKKHKKKKHASSSSSSKSTSKPKTAPVVEETDAILPPLKGEVAQDELEGSLPTNTDKEPILPPSDPEPNQD